MCACVCVPFRTRWLEEAKRGIVTFSCGEGRARGYKGRGLAVDGACIYCLDIFIFRWRKEIRPTILLRTTQSGIGEGNYFQLRFHLHFWFIFVPFYPPHEQFVSLLVVDSGFLFNISSFIANPQAKRPFSELLLLLRTSYC